VTGLVAAWWEWIAPVALQGAALILLVALLDRVLRGRARPRVRMALWTAALARLALPAGWHLPTSLTAPAAAALGVAPAVPADGGRAIGPWLPVLAGAWILGAAALAAVAILRARAARRRLLGEGSAPVPEAALRALERAARAAGLPRPPALVVSAAAPGPAVIGLLRPLVVLPVPVPPEEDLFPMLLHECAHVARRDPWARLAVRAAAAAFWFHPAVHYAVRRTESLRELCCDATVARILRERTPEYRAALLRQARRIAGPAVPGLAFHSGDGLAARIRALEGAPWTRTGPERAAAAAAALFVAGCLAPMGPEMAPPGARRLAAARAVLEAASRGERPGCWSLRLAGWTVAREEGFLPAGVALDSGR
jgi:beta-lactamase regulating signal transducer with metallopeptidase domain